MRSHHSCICSAVVTVWAGDGRVYQVHRDDMGRHELGSVYQPVCPSNLDDVAFGGRSEPDAVSVLKGLLKKKKNTFYLARQLGPAKYGGENLIDLDVLWEQIVAVGAVVEDDLVEGGGGEFLHLAVVIAAVFVLADHPLPNRQVPHGGLAPLERNNQSVSVAEEKLPGRSTAMER